MPVIISMLALSVAGLFGVSSVMDKAEDSADELSTTALYIGGLLLVGVGSFLVYKNIK